MRRERWIGVGVFALALAVRLLHLQQVVANDPFYDQPSVDSLIYVDWAKRIAGGEWLGSEAFFLSPLYGYMLGGTYALVGPSFLWPLVLNALFGAATCAVVYALACRLFDLRVALVAAALACFYRMEIFYEGAPLVEALQTLLCAVWVWTAVRALETSTDDARGSRPDDARGARARGRRRGLVRFALAGPAIGPSGLARRRRRAVAGWGVWSYGRSRAGGGGAGNPAAALARGLEKARLFWSACGAWDVRSVRRARPTSWLLRLPLVDFAVLAPLALAGI